MKLYRSKKRNSQTNKKRTKKDKL